MAAAKIALGMQEELSLGNMDSQRDWGYAPEFTEGMWRILQNDTPDDFVLATGEMHTVRNFTRWSFKHVGIDLEFKGVGVDEVGIDVKTGKTVVRVNPAYFRPTEVEELLGDATKAKDKLGWVAETKAEKLCEIMAKADFEKVSKRGY